MDYDDDPAGAVFFYGIFCDLISLQQAALTHKLVAPPFLALDLIRLRQRKGTLQIKGCHTTISALPAEVIEQIRSELISLEMEEASRMIVHGLRCPSCTMWLGQTPDLSSIDYAELDMLDWIQINEQPNRDKEIWREGLNPPQCPHCIEWLADPEWNIKPDFSAIAALLAAFGLSIAMKATYAEADIMDPYYFDWQRALAISIPVHRHQPPGNWHRLPLIVPEEPFCLDVLTFDQEMLASAPSRRHRFTDLFRRYSCLKVAGNVDHIAIGHGRRLKESHKYKNTRFRSAISKEEERQPVPCWQLFYARTEEQRISARRSFW